MYPHSYQNKVNNAQGHSFESIVMAGCQYYKLHNRAEIDKTPEPFRVIEKHHSGIFTGRFTSRAQPDFQGTLQGGQSIVFETKYTRTDRLNRGILTPAQMEALERHYNAGAVSGVCAGIGDEFFFVPWIVWRNMKQIYGRQYVRADDIQGYKVKFSGAVLFLDYVKGINKL